MVKLIRKTHLEAKKPDKQTAPTTNQIKSKIQSIMETECDSLSDSLEEEIKDKITLSSGVKLENLYTTMDDANTLETMIKGEKENSPMSPAYSISHLSELEPVEDGVCVKYKESEIINPRLFYLLNKQFHAINKKSKDFHVSFHVQRKGKGYVITCFGNPLDTAANIHIDSKGHLAL